MRHSFVAAAVVLASLTHRPARADDSDAQRASAAQALFDTAVAEMEAKQFASACPKLEEVTRLVPDGLGAKVQLAECYEGWGRIASAWSEWTKVEVLAGRQLQRDRQSTAAERAAALKPRLATVTITVAPSVQRIEGVVVRRDGTEVGRAQWGAPIPIDAGPHDLVVTAPGYHPVTKSFKIAADGTTMTVPVDAMIVDPEAKERSGTTIIQETPNTWQAPLGVVSMAVGGTAVVVGSIFGGLAIARNDESNDGPCNPETNRCNTDGLALRDEARAFGTTSTVAIAVGAGLAVGGLTLFLTAPGVLGDDAPADGKPRVTAVRLTLSGIVAEGSFQ